MSATKYEWLSRQDWREILLVELGTDKPVASITLTPLHAKVHIKNNPHTYIMPNMDEAKEFILWKVVGAPALKEEIASLSVYRDAIIHLNNALQTLNNRK